VLIDATLDAGSRYNAPIAKEPANVEGTPPEEPVAAVDRARRAHPESTLTTARTPSAATARPFILPHLFLPAAHHGVRGPVQPLAQPRCLPNIGPGVLQDGTPYAQGSIRTRGSRTSCVRTPGTVRARRRTFGPRRVPTPWRLVIRIESPTPIDRYTIQLTEGGRYERGTPPRLGSPRASARC
jgi:hypothetical protein